MKTITITTTQEINLDELLSQFQKNWGIPFDGTKKTKCMMFEDFVFGQHINPSTAQQIVEAAGHYVIQKNWSGVRHGVNVTPQTKTVLRINPKLEG